MKIALIDDHKLLTESLKNLIQSKLDGCEVFTFSSGDDFVQSAVNITWDVVITDLIMPGQYNGYKILEYCKEHFGNKCKVIVLTSLSDIQTIRTALRKGATGFLPKNVEISELIDAIAKVNENKQFISKDLRENILNNVFSKDPIDFHLSPREQEVLIRVCKGDTIKEIAFDLKLSRHTVQYYHKCVMNKLRVKRTSDLIVFALKHGLYNPEMD